MTHSQLDRVDPELRAPLQELLGVHPGGVYAISDLAQRRQVDARLADETAEAVRAAQTCSTVDLEVPGPPGGLPVPIRIYRPEGFTPGGPAIFFIHGGGM